MSLNRTDLEVDARNMTDHELKAAIDWHRALMNHADDNFRHAEYQNQKLIVEVVEAEQAGRRVAHHGV